MSEGVLGFDNSGPSCCLSIERQKTVLNVVFKGVHSGGVEGVSWSCKRAIFVMSGLFLHNCIIPFSLNCIDVLRCCGYFLTVNMNMNIEYSDPRF